MVAPEFTDQSKHHEKRTTRYYLCLDVKQKDVYKMPHEKSEPLSYENFTSSYQFTENIENNMLNYTIRKQSTKSRFGTLYRKKWPSYNIKKGRMEKVIDFKKT